jgi:hypothetical protein
MKTYPKMPIITAQHPKTQITTNLFELQLRGNKEFLEVQYAELSEMFAERRKSDPGVGYKTVVGLRDWPQAPSQRRTVGRYLAQEHFLNSVNATRTNLFSKAAVVVNPAQTMVYFIPKCFKSDQWINSTFALKGIMLKAKFVDANDHYFTYVNEEDCIFAVVTIGYGVFTNKPQAFLLLRQRDKDVIWELEEFSMVSPVDYFYDKTYKPEAFDGDRIAFVCFSKERELLYTGLPKVNRGLFESEGDDNSNLPTPAKEIPDKA